MCSASKCPARGETLYQQQKSRKLECTPVAIFDPSHTLLFIFLIYRKYTNIFIQTFIYTYIFK